MRGGAVAVLCVMALAARCVAEVAVDLEVELERAPPATATGEPSSSTCSSLCSQTYPEHTYPNMDNNLACMRGCRLAQIEGLMAWPGKPCKENCMELCGKAYTNRTNQDYACKVGCGGSAFNVVLREEEKVEEGTEQGYFELFASLSFVDHEFDTLQKQAEQLERTLPMNSGFTVMEDSNGNIAVFTYQGFHIDGAVTLTDSDAQLTLDNSFSTHDDEHIIGSGCMWRRLHHSTIAHVLMLASIVVLAFTLMACVCSLGGKGREEVKKRRPHHLAVSQSYEPVKFPLHHAPEKQPLIVPIRLDSGMKVEGILSVV